MASITARTADGDMQESATNMAALLTKSVQTSIDMANATELAAAGIQDDSLRVALTALASPLIAGLFERSGKIPEDADLKKITTSLQAVLSFSENFAPNPENTERLKTLGAEGQAVDAHQTNIQYIHAITPIINATGAFSFGQSEQKLVMEITSRLVAKAAALRTTIIGDLQEDEQKFTELALLRILTEIYTACHEAETNHLMTMNDEERANQPQAPGGGLALDNVWKAFDLRVAMLESLAKSTLPAAKKETTDKAPTVAPTQTQEKPTAESSLTEETPPDSPAETITPLQEAETAQPTTDNPMTMFSKPNAENAEEATAPPPQETPAQEQPPAETPAPSTVPEETAQDSGVDGDDQGSPMSFFSQKPKSDDES